MSKIETKYVGGRVVTTKQSERGGVPVGLIEGYTATWDVDRGGAWFPPDQFVKGAFADSIQRHRDSGNRQVRLTWQHRELMGGIPIDTVREDEKGLFGVAEVNLETRLGREAYSLAQQGVLVDFSIGFEALDWKMETIDGQEKRVITKAEYWHSALVDEPMNPAAQVTAVKAYTKADLAGMTTRELEAALVDCGWSEKAAKILASGHGKTAPEELIQGGEDWTEVLERLEDLKRAISV